MIQENDQIIIKTSKILKPFTVYKDRVIRVERSKFRLNGAIGHPYGTTFEVKQLKLVKIEKDTQTDDIPADCDAEGDRDNRNLKDDGENQKLNKEDLQALRKRGADVVENLVKNSSTFKDKTEYSQQKYINKKKKKWESRFTILKPTTRLVAEMQYSKGPARISNLRHDSIAQLLTYTNVRAHAKVMLCESVAGLLLGAVIERLGGFGSAVQFFTGSRPSMESINLFGFPPDIRQTILSYPLIEVRNLQLKNATTKDSDISNESKLETSTTQDIVVPDPSNGNQTAAIALTKTDTSLTPSGNDVTMTDTDNDKLDNGGDGAVKEVLEEGKCGTDCGDALKMENESGDSGDEEQSSTAKGDKKRRNKTLSLEEKMARRLKRQQETAQTKALLEEQAMDTLIVAVKQHPTPIVLGLLPFLAPCRPFAVHCMYKEPLLDCYVKLRNRGGVVNLQLSETWLREHQVLPMRTHPTIQMSATGGYLLTGTTVPL